MKHSPKWRKEDKKEYEQQNKKLREEKCLYQQDLADRANTSFQQIYKLEKGERTLTPAWAKRLAKALGTEPIQVAPELADVFDDLSSADLKRLVQGTIWRDEHFSGMALKDIALRENCSQAYVGTAIFSSFEILQST